MIILDYLRQLLTAPNTSHPSSSVISNFEISFLTFNGMEDLIETRKIEPFHKRITPPEPKKGMLASVLFFHAVVKMSSRAQERPKPLITLDRLVCRRFSCNFFNNVSSFVDFTVRPRLGELFPGIFGHYDFQLMGLEIQDREITDEFENFKPELIFQKSLGKKITRGVRSVGREVRRSSRKTARAFKKAGKKTGKWIKDHPTETAVIGVVVAAVIVTIATAGTGAGVTTAAAGEALRRAATTKNNDRPRRIREDEEEEPRPVTPPPVNPMPPLPPVQPIYTEPSGVPRELTQPFTPSLPDCIKIPPEYRYSNPLPNMPVPIPPIGSPDVPSYRQSVNPITSVPEFKNPALLQERRIEPSRTTSAAVIPSSSGDYLTTPKAHPISPPEEKPLIKEVVEGLKYSFAKDSHEVLDTIGNLQMQTAKLENIAVDAINQVIPDTKALHKRDLAEVQEKITAGHQNIDDFFDTTLANGYTPETKALMEELGIKKPMLLIAPMPGSSSLVGRTTAATGDSVRTTTTALSSLEKAVIQEGTILGRQAVVLENAAAIEGQAINFQNILQKIHGPKANAIKLKETETAISQWIGAESRVIKNQANDTVLLSKDGNRRVRFDINNPHGDIPHMHIEEKLDGKWGDAVSQHRIYPKGE